MTDYVFCHKCGTWCTWEENRDMHDTSEHKMGSDYKKANKKYKIPEEMVQWQGDKQ